MESGYFARGAPSAGHPRPHLALWPAWPYWQGISLETRGFIRSNRLEASNMWINRNVRERVMFPPGGDVLGMLGMARNLVG
eukprot:6609932-Lingulodinium_polyedra.AAC.1